MGGFSIVNIWVLGEMYIYWHMVMEKAGKNTWLACRACGERGL